MSAAEYKKEREKTSSDDKKSGTNKKMMNLVKKFVWGDGAFSPVEKAIGYHGEIIAEGESARDLYSLAS